MIRNILFAALVVGFIPCNAQTANPSQYQYIFTVAQDGTGDFTFIQDAINAMRGFPLAPITLYVKNGVYREKIFVPANNTDITFVGESVDKTIIVFGDYSGDGVHSTFSSYTAKISGSRFTAENITFVNDAGRVGQAVALFVDGDRAIFRNCKFIGNQDTMYLGGENARQYFVDCYVEGTTDFIFGPSTAVFQNCRIHAKTNSYITAANTPDGKKFGLVFLDCRITADSSVTKLYLGRPWRAYSNTSFVRCELPKVIAPEGWDNWSNPENEKTVYYAEYKNKGEGANTSRRVTWSRQLSDKEAKQFAVETIFKDENSTVRKDPAWYALNQPVSFDGSKFTNKNGQVIDLYAEGVPNSRPVPDAESSTFNNNVTRIAKVSHPTLTIYRPAKPNGQAVVICPGGGYTILAFDKEGTRVAEVFNSWGVTAFVLKYRIPDDSYCVDKSLAPLQDAQQAVRLVRTRAKEWNVDPDKIGIMGFSAGGHLASTAATHFNFNADAANTDTTSVRPDFAILLYPVVSFDSAFAHLGSRRNLIGEQAPREKVDFFSNELHVTAQTPPSFLVHAGDDRAVPVENSIRFYEACVKHNVPAEMHLYPHGGHGFGMNNTTTFDNWMERLHLWMKGLK